MLDEGCLHSFHELSNLCGEQIEAKRKVGENSKKEIH
jgi:hypothetical protein